MVVDWHVPLSPGAACFTGFWQISIGGRIKQALSVRVIAGKSDLLDLLNWAKSAVKRHLRG